MSRSIGVLLICAGVAFGVYAGFMWAFIGGVRETVIAIQADAVDPSRVAFGFARVMFSGLIGTLAACLFAIPGMFLMDVRK